MKKTVKTLKGCPKFAFQMAAVSIGVLKITSALGGKLLPGMQSVLFNEWFILSPLQISLIGVVITSQLEILNDQNKKRYHNAALVTMLGTVLLAASNIDSVVFNWLIAPALIMVASGASICITSGERNIPREKLFQDFKEIVQPMISVKVPFVGK